MPARKPDFFIIGAPKCGTTSLASWLDSHPQACISRPKEPHFFVPVRSPLLHTVAQYEQCFAHARPEHVAIGDASTNMIYFPNGIRKILEYQPDARFIICVRNPIDMVVSLHNYEYYLDLHNISDFLRAWDSDEEIWPPYYGRPSTLRDYYRFAGALGQHCEAVSKIVAPDRLLLVDLIDIAANSSGERKRITEFLGVSTFDAPFPRENVARTHRSRRLRDAASWLVRAKRRLGVSHSFGMANALVRLNAVRGRGVATATPEIRAVLAAHFREDIALLERLLGRDLGHWTAPEATEA